MSESDRNRLIRNTLEKMERHENEYARSELLKSIGHISEQLQRQADAQEEIRQQLNEEERSRSQDDKKYFWLGVLTSLIVSMTVEHGAELIAFLRQLFQQ